MLNAKLKFFVFSVIIFSAIFFIGNNVKAAIDVDIIQGSWLNNFDYPSYPVGGNTFIPSHDNISHLWTDGFAQVTSSISICKGIPAPTSQADLNTNGPTCNWSGNELIYNTGQIEKTWITISSSPPDILMFEFPEIVPLVIGENYYYIQEFISNEGGFTFMSCPSGCGGGRILETLNANETMMFGTYYNTEYIPPVLWEINPISPLSDSVVGSKFNFITEYTIPESNTGTIFYNVYFTADDTVHIYAGAWHETATTTAIDILPVVFLDGIYLWNATLLDGATGVIMASTTPETFGVKALADLIFDLPFGLSQNDVCGGIATSTGITDLHIFGDIECGLKTTGVWLLSPSDSSMVMLYDAYEDFKASFPFSAFFDLTTTISDAIATTTTNQVGTIGIPFVDTGGEIYILPIISSSTISNAIGSTNATLFRDTITGLMWILAGILIYIQFKKK